MLKALLINLVKAMFRDRTDQAGQEMIPSLNPVIEALERKSYSLAAELAVQEINAHPNNARAHYLLGRALIELNNKKESITHLERAVALRKDFAEAHFELARVMCSLNDFEQAEKTCRRAVKLKPMSLDYRLLLVEILEVAGKKRTALQELAGAQEIAPERVDLLLRVCDGLDTLARYREMLPLAERALLEMGESTEVLSCVAVARHGVDDMLGAVAACRRAIALAKTGTKLEQVYVTLGSSLFGLGKHDESLAAYKKALKLNPSSVIAKYNTGLIFLMQHRFRQGWEGFERRFDVKRNLLLRRCEPRWRGGSLNRQSILVMREQGLGDEIMYSSCYPDLSGLAERCFAECDPRLQRLFSRSFPKIRFFPLQDLLTKEQTDPGEPVNWKVYAGSLPHFFRNSVNDFPEHRGYLRPDPARVQYWASRLSGLGQGLKIGISWRGGTSLTLGRRRSLSLNQLKGLLETAGVHWINLQYGERKQEIESFLESNGIAIHDWPEAIDGDYDETAALVEGLDLVISVATAVVHLSGALGKSVWIMAASVPEWRYGASGSRMPWYPSARVFRQPDVDQWDFVLDQLRAELALKLSHQARM